MRDLARSTLEAGGAPSDLPTAAAMARSCRTYRLQCWHIAKWMRIMSFFKMPALLYWSLEMSRTTSEHLYIAYPRLSPFFSRHSRRRFRARNSITPKLVLLRLIFLQISLVSISSTSLR